MKTFLLVLASISILFAQAADGPFGIAFGTPLSKLNATQDGEVYNVVPPKPHPAFEGYMVRATPEHGVYWIKAYTDIVYTPVYGDGLRRKTDEIADQIESVYGTCTQKFDFLRSGSIWDEPEDWMAGLNKKERYYLYSWDAEKAPALIPRKIESLQVAAMALANDKGVVLIEYTGTSYDAAVKSIAEKQKNAF